MVNRLIFAIAFALVAICATSEPTTIKETFYFSRECPSSHWYTNSVDHDSVTMQCDYDPDKNDDSE